MDTFVLALSVIGMTGPALTMLGVPLISALSPALLLFSWLRPDDLVVAAPSERTESDEADRLAA